MECSRQPEVHWLTCGGSGAMSFHNRWWWNHHHTITASVIELLVSLKQLLVIGIGKRTPTPADTPCRLGVKVHKTGWCGKALLLK